MYQIKKKKNTFLKNITAIKGNKWILKLNIELFY